jgi:high-affinity iron transporter
MARFFRITGVVLVFVAAGLVASAIHTAHEAGWIDFGQTQVADLTWLMAPGSIVSALLTGVFGLQPEPVAIEVVGYLLFLVPMLVVVLWPAPSRPPRSTPPVTTAIQPTTDQ